ncbi:MFS transporter, partial [Streptomyces sp. NPDC057433]|uniref:MFS transporter n=1 Tax=Streptomyces sp. NPDC057433 TaxID=3346132 RepID=UPI0036C6011D
MTRPTTPRRPGRPRRGLFPCLVLLTALGALDRTMMATALPDVVSDLGSPARAPWVITAYTLALTAAMPAVGALGDRFGRRRTLVASIVLFVGASVACGLAGDMTSLAVARLVQGIGGAGLLALPQAVVADAVPARDRAAYLGPLGAVFAVATVASPLVGGWLTDAASWRWIFWINVPLGAAAAALVFHAVPPHRTGADRETAPPPFDTTGAALLAVTASGLALTTAVVGVYGWTAGTAAAASATAPATVATLWWERHATNPVLPVDMLRRRPLLLCSLLALLPGAGLFGALAYLPSWIQRAYGASATTAGLMLLPVTPGIVSRAARRHEGKART